MGTFVKDEDFDEIFASRKLPREIRGHVAGVLREVDALDNEIARLRAEAESEQDLLLEDETFYSTRISELQQHIDIALKAREANRDITENFHVMNQKIRETIHDLRQSVVDQASVEHRNLTEAFSKQLAAKAGELMAEVAAGSTASTTWAERNSALKASVDAVVVRAEAAVALHRGLARKARRLTAELATTRHEADTVSAHAQLAAKANAAAKVRTAELQRRLDDIHAALAAFDFDTSAQDALGGGAPDAAAAAATAAAVLAASQVGLVEHAGTNDAAAARGGDVSLMPSYEDGAQRAEREAAARARLLARARRSLTGALARARRAYELECANVQASAAALVAAEESVTPLQVTFAAAVQDVARELVRAAVRMRSDAAQAQRARARARTKAMSVAVSADHTRGRARDSSSAAHRDGGVSDGVPADDGTKDLDGGDGANVRRSRDGDEPSESDSATSASSGERERRRATRREAQASKASALAAIAARRGGGEDREEDDTGAPRASRGALARISRDTRVSNRSKGAAGGVAAADGTHDSDVDVGGSSDGEGGSGVFGVRSGVSDHRAVAERTAAATAAFPEAALLPPRVLRQVLTFGERERALIVDRLISTPAVLDDVFGAGASERRAMEAAVYAEASRQGHLLASRLWHSWQRWVAAADGPTAASGAEGEGTTATRGMAPTEARLGWGAAGSTLPRAQGVELGDE